MPPAVSGSGGHDGTFRVTRALVYGFDLGPDAALDLLRTEYNPRCRPPWSEEQLCHKVEDADRIPFRKPRGYLRNEPITGRDEVSEGPNEIVLRATPAAGKRGKIVVVAVRDGSELHRDTIDPNSATGRKRFIDAVVRAPSNRGTAIVPEEPVRANLEHQLRELGRVPPSSDAPGGAPSDEDRRATELAKMPGDVRAEAEAEALLNDPNLLDRVSEAIGALGVVGEGRNRLILYLTGTSAQLPRPLAVITRGASSSGSRSWPSR
ncbi:Phage/plasmid primase, P4 family, C-terminal domain protein OS=Singulisphaera acidiphila (strain ATCC BAA-1392 / DSM 18658 / VKM B-2454 / MOB10) GN=Sinac_4213 PE=4 SV=1 [Gemmata massiliana]|uniref:Phage/plasmid primase, P4 family, C-terminal domain protein n=1 Tax=Gemmata massiliana TaxID=1210884 RepID=A0A6P2D6T5_9BACT|nr:hypothetical protein [Gemmata massiliana]VTR95140.1 Phage/plasmid primase, P4 family, C-terminal domain protein OS=Singulisphaera acidiphila (strain ATCC BAA-1392 / DSM 18658 / VKM B-2454 / MOB10) GN=Sinac_4213 PE=4 SV=1 [Gemmata massiliana]